MLVKNMKKTDPPSGKRELPVLKLLVFIVDWSKSNALTDILKKEYVRFHFICKGRGTASSDILDLLGIGSTEKAVVLCLEPDFRVPDLLKHVSRKLGFHSPGTGIAFTIPLSGINNPILQVFSQEAEMRVNSKIQKDADKSNSEAKFELVITAVNQGYSDDLMAKAKEAGATGGTVLNARSVAHEGTVKFFGISVQEEKEIVAILTKRSNKTPIMQAISQSFGLATEAKGIVFSLPVDDITGLDLS